MSNVHPQNKNIPLTYTGNVRSHSQLGGYPLFYLTTFDEVMCAACVQEEIESGDWGGADIVTQCGVNYENHGLHCNECDAKIEAAYGEEEQEHGHV